MRTFADPTTCPSCGAPATAPRCGTCAVDLRGPQAREVLRLLTVVDGLIGTMRADAATWRAAAPFVPSQPYPAPTVAPTRVRRPWSVGALLLALGALCLVVAAFVFVSVSWGSLGLGGRTAVLVAVTAVVGAAAGVSTVRRLRGSAEALWAVTAGLVTLDYWAARGYGLAGLGSLDGAVATVGYGLLVGAGGVAAALASRGRLRAPLVVGELTALLGTASVAAGLAALSDGPFRGGLVGLLVAGGVAVGAGRVGLRVLAVGSTVLAVVTYGLLTLAQVVLLGVDLVDGGGTVVAEPVLRGAALVAVAAVVAAVALLAARRQAVAAAAVAVGVAQVVVPLVVAAALAEWFGDSVLGVSVVLAASVVGLAAAGLPSLGAVGTGLRASAAVWAAPVVALLVGWVGLAVAAGASTVSPVWAGSATGRVAVDPDAPLGPWWTSLVLAAAVVLALALALVLAPRWRGGPLTASRRPVMVASGVAAVTLLVQPLLVPSPVWVPVVVAGLVTVGALATSWRRRSVALEAAVLVTVGVASGLALVDQGLSLVTWCVAALVLAGVAARGHARWVVAAASGAGAGVVVAVVATGVDLLEAPARGVQLATAVAVLAVAAAAQLLARLVASPRRDAVRLPVEALAVAVALGALVAVPGESLAWRALVWTVLGAGAALVGLLVADRRPVGLAGSVLLAGAYVMRLLASDVGVVEAYTLPIAVVLGAAGVLVLRRRPSTRSWLALGPALALGLLPSLPLVLDDPTTLRGLLLGVGALAVLGAGVVLRWQAPVVAGASVAAVLAVRHLGPYADAVPRWVLLAAAGLALLAVGVTWEGRVRQARSAALSLRALR